MGGGDRMGILGMGLTGMLFALAANASDKTCYELSSSAREWFNPTHALLCMRPENGGGVAFRITSQAVPDPTMSLRHYEKNAQAPCEGGSGNLEHYIPENGAPSSISGLG